MEFEYTGYNTHRLKKDDDYHKLEVIFTKVINQELEQNPNYLDQIVQKNLTKEPIFGIKQFDYLTVEEQKIALSVIQWLGTPVGQGFLEKVNKEK